MEKAKNITIPAGTAILLREMFTSHKGIDMSAVIKDLAGNGINETLVTINLGLLLNGKVLELPKTVYEHCNDKRIRAYVYKSHSLLEDKVLSRYYEFNKKINEETQESYWEQSSYYYSDNCSVARWFDYDTELPEGVVLPEIVDRD